MSDRPSSSESSQSDDPSSRSGAGRFILASTGRPVVVIKPPLAQYDDVDIDAPPAPATLAHARKLANRDPKSPSHFAVRDEDVPRPPDEAPEGQRVTGGISAGAKHLSAPEEAEQRRPVRGLSGQSDKWWTFAAGTNMRKRLDDYLRGEEAEKRNGESGDPEKGESPREKRPHLHVDLQGLRGARQNSSNQAQTPGWNVPWKPFQSNNGYMGDYRISEGPSNSIPGQTRTEGFFNSFGDFLLHNVWAPVLLRLLNMAFTAALIGLAGRIQYIEDSNGLQGIIGESTILALVVGPLTLLHVFVAIYLEYFGPPIGIWRLRTKMMMTLVEIVFISMWAALLSLAFDDYYTTQATCTEWTPNARWRPMFQNSSINGSATDQLCDDQGALVAMTFIGLMLYQAVLVISLFRIFSKVSRK